MLEKQGNKMSVTSKFKDENKLAVQDQKDLARVSANMSIYYAYSERGLKSVYDLAEALITIGCDPVITQGPVAKDRHGLCYELETGAIPVRLMEDIKDVIQVNNMSSHYTGYRTSSTTVTLPQETEFKNPQMAEKLKAIRPILSKQQPA